MYKTIYAVFDYKDLADINEIPKLLTVTTDFDKAKKCFESEYEKSYKPSPIDSGDENTVLCFFRGEMWRCFVALEEVGWIDENGTHYNVDGLENTIIK